MGGVRWTPRVNIGAIFKMAKLITEKLDGIFVLVVWFVLLGFCLVGCFFWLFVFFL